MARSRLVAIVCTALFALAACGDDGSSADAQPYIDAVVDDLTSDGGGPTEEDAECIGEAIVGAVGADTLEDRDITPDDFAAADSFADLDTGVDADDLRSELESGLADCDLGDSFADLLLSEFPVEITGDDRQCVVDALDDNDELPNALAAGFVGEESDESAFESALAGSLAECPEVLGGLLADSIDGAGVAVDDDARQCIIDEVRDGGTEFVEAIVDGGPASQQLGQDIAAACLPDA